jgi:hypothetical protein
LCRQFKGSALGSRIDIDGEWDRNAIGAAFIAAREAGRSSVECYRSGVELWQRMRPDHAPEDAALEVVRIILELRCSELEDSALTETGMRRQLAWRM